MKRWEVQYRSVKEGFTIVEAESAEEARRMVEDGDFTEDPAGWLARVDAKGEVEEVE